MNLNFLVGTRTNDPLMNVRLLEMLQCVNYSNPVQSIESISFPSLPDPDIHFVPGSTTTTNSVVIVDGLQMLVLIGGATGAAQITNLVAGLEAGPDPRDNTSSLSIFYQAGRTLLSALFGFGGYAGKNVYLVGHSFGGGVAQVAGIYLLSLGLARSVTIISYGAPRAGGPDLAKRLTNADNTRWWNEGDQVPWLPPHADEVPSIYLVSPISLVRGSNNLCLAPWGYGLRGNGTVVPGMGLPPPNWGFMLSLYNYMRVAMVAPVSDAHAVATYLARMRLVLVNNPTPIPRPAERPEVPLIQRPREREATIQIGRAEVFADATAPTGSTRTYVVPTVTDPAAPRYRAGRDGSVWVIKLGGQIVGSATGKRSAKRIARTWNASARATLIV